jgi:hypothetical protein
LSPRINAIANSKSKTLELSFMDHPLSNKVLLTRKTKMLSKGS